ncbi:Uma2 family endonuclease [Thermoanaerobacter thermohydrosulfuricus]|nr:Endonuclease, Uma2 family (restriction endonuclease fold) [Thermoanaerobacter thermohydrosulfuricus]
MENIMPKNKKITYEEFKEIDSKTDEMLEFINGEIYLLSAPSVAHQRILTNLSTEFGIYFRDKKCKHFVAPLDVILQNDQEKHKVQPDITVICDEKGLTENNYTGVPELVVEILSPSTASKDYIIKMDLYMRFGIKEYWIVSPKNQEIQIFSLQDGVYGEPINFSKDEVLKSVIFEDLTIDLKNIF